MFDPIKLASAHLYMYLLIYLAERMKERSTLSIFSSFWYASWVGFLTWKKAKQFEQSHLIGDFVSETSLKLPNVLAADIHHRPSFLALSSRIFFPLLSAPIEFKHLPTQAQLSHLRASPHISAHPCLTYPWFSLFLTAIHPSTMSYQKLFFIFWTPNQKF